MSVRHAIVVMGTAGAGKSRIGAALAAALESPFVEGDAFHSPENVARMAAGIPLTDDNRRDWLIALAELLGAARARNESVVLTCSALKRRYRDTLRHGDDALRLIMLHGDTALLRERLASRTGHYMPASLLDSQLAALEVPSPDEDAWTFECRESPDAIVHAILKRLRSTSAGTAE